MTDDFLNTRIGDSERKLKIIDISKKTVTVSKGNVSEKIEFKTEEEDTKRTFNISDSYVKTSDGDIEISGLWYTENNGVINRSSTLAKVLEYYDANSIGDLMGKTVMAYPDPKNYLVLIACNPGEI